MKVGDKFTMSQEIMDAEGYDWEVHHGDDIWPGQVWAIARGLRSFAGSLEIMITRESDTIPMNGLEVDAIVRAIQAPVPDPLRRAWVFARRGLRRQLTDSQLALARATRREAIKTQELEALEAELTNVTEQAFELAHQAATLAMETTLLGIKLAEHIAAPAILTENKEVLAANQAILDQAQTALSHNVQVHFDYLRATTEDKGPLKWLN